MSPHPPAPPLREWPGALLELIRLGWVTRFRLGGAYWRWREETAFGRGSPPRGARLAAVLGYAAWARRMRRLGRRQSG